MCAALATMLLVATAATICNVVGSTFSAPAPSAVLAVGGTSCGPLNADTKNRGALAICAPIVVPLEPVPLVAAAWYGKICPRISPSGNDALLTLK